MEEMRCIVSGKVQGVSYRDFIQKLADDFLLAGYVRNLPDSTVEVVAQGSRADLEKFLDLARRGPRFARVSDMHIEWREAREVHAAFKVVF